MFIKTLAEFLQKLRSVKKAAEASPDACSATIVLLDAVINQEEVDSTVINYPVLEHILQYIDVHLSGALDVPKLAGIAGLSQANFTRIFSRHVGSSPADYILQKRLERATKLLSDSQLSVNHISLSCGFKDANYFSKVFKRIFSISPVEFRTTGMYSSPKSVHES
ncbi:helix-turn-helix domain-containing protein [Reinekea blandensis]|uniref:Transcriptional regulator, AraC family protein n=1 Tax=Reinekea blandensis MED297 TaxID=314283 RepID=A4B8V7_9GAMM|nr:AraC family transcriptional regulator [Reinekea blandensis]EAR11058.1 transcriptional regulator, AraC family protein [Reinekea sp. MED297] [Reinekea blandensis MED297]